jgi:hypothetical protein
MAMGARFGGVFVSWLFKNFLFAGAYDASF